MKAIVAFFKAVISGTSLAYTQLLKSFFMILIFGLVLTTIMWLLNIAGVKEVNYFFFFVGGIIVFFVGLNPIALVASIIFGAVSGGINKTGIIKGAVSGPSHLLHLTIGLMYTFFCVAGVLATTSFVESPSSFFAIFAMATLLCTAAAFHFSVIGNLAKGIITVYALFVCLCAIWAIIPVNSKSNIGMSGNTIQRIDNVIGSGKPRVKKQIDILVTKEREAIDKLVREENERLKALEDKERARRKEAEAKKKVLKQKEEKENKEVADKEALKTKLDKLIEDNQ